jgi:hypothetical protein
MEEEILAIAGKRRREEAVEDSFEFSARIVTNLIPHPTGFLCKYSF